ncbi:hypothetical protein [Okeania sp. KiyG1]|nr:hypothetical protein [Okeania sp. KiyG1]
MFDEKRDHDILAKSEVRSQKSEVIFVILNPLVSRRGEWHSPSYIMFG